MTFQWTDASNEVETVTLALPLGTHTFTLTVSDGSESDTDTVTVTVEDTLAPATSASFPNPSGNAGWYTTDVSVTLSVAADKRNIAPSKAWEGGIPCERMKPFKRIQLVKVQSG